MIINKNTSNVIVVTLLEKQTTDNPDWLLELTNDFTKEVEVLSVIDISNYSTRYNEFVVIEPNDVDLKAGSWSYRFLEMVPASPPDSDPANYLAICETGICTVIDSAENPIVNFEEDEGENKVFDA